MNEESLRFALQMISTWRRSTGALQAVFLRRAIVCKFTHQSQVFEAWNWFYDGYTAKETT